MTARKHPSPGRAGALAVLVGPPGAGKTTVGNLLARRLDVPFRDTDHDVETAAGMCVADIFVTKGEPAFRELEEAAVSAALATHTGILAVGGGAVLAESTRAQLRGRNVVFLDVSPAEAARRVGLARERPVLALNPRARLRALLEERRPVYVELARHGVDTTPLSPEQVADDVARWLDGER